MATTTQAADKREIWVLRITDGDGRGNLVHPIEDVGNPILAFWTEDDAEQSAKYHAEAYDIACKPERIKML